MNKLKVLVASAVVLAGVFLAGVGAANAQGVPECTIDNIPLDKWQSSFSVANGQTTAKFTLKGADNCKKAMTVAVWKAPAANGQPVNDQKLYAYKTGVFGKGQNTLTVKLPDNCYFQADLLKGTSPTAPDGTANYAYQNGKIVENHPLVDFKFGGERKCEDQPEKCPYDSSMEKNDPNCKQKEVCPFDSTMEKNDPNCKQQETPVTVSSIPSTGAGSILASTLGLSTSAGLAVKYFRTKRSLR